MFYYLKICVKIYMSEKWVVWFVILNNYFQFLNNILHISTHFFTHTYFHKYFQTKIFNFLTHVPNGPKVYENESNVV